jgi:hypothetical protein
MFRSKDCWHGIGDIQALYGIKGDHWRGDLTVECRAGNDISACCTESDVSQRPPFAYLLASKSRVRTDYSRNYLQQAYCCVSSLHRLRQALGTPNTAGLNPRASSSPEEGRSGLTQVSFTPLHSIIRLENSFASQIAREKKLLSTWTSIEAFWFRAERELCTQALMWLVIYSHTSEVSAPAGLGRYLVHNYCCSCQHNSSSIAWINMNIDSLGSWEADFQNGLYIMLLVLCVLTLYVNNYLKLWSHRI